MKREKILNIKNKYLDKLNIVKEKSNKLSLFRLIAFISFILILVVAIAISNLFLGIISIFVFIIFIALVIYHEKLSKHKRHLNLLVVVMEEYESRFNNDWVRFKDDGLDYLNKENIMLSDLDVIGEASLFKYLNITKTKGGRNLLFDRLSNSKLTKEEVLETQGNVLEVANNLEFSVNFQANLKQYALDTNNRDLNESVKLLTEEVNYSRKYLYFSLLFPIILLVLVGLTISGEISWLWILGSLILNLSFSFFVYGSYKDTFDNISRCTRCLGYSKAMYLQIAGADFKNKSLVLKQMKIKSAIEGIKAAKKVESYDSYRANSLSYILINALLPLNLLIIDKFNNFKNKYFNIIESSITFFEHFELYTSLAIIEQVKENTCQPFLEEKIGIKFLDITHPLLNENICIKNSFITNNGVSIITGSNMSGKTSFLRTIGINLILMNAGGIVNAKEFSASYLKIFTSMRIFDDINQGISTFYAEILRIKKAIEYQKTKEPIIVFIDEVFKGTNSNDRIAGAISMIKNLNKPNVILFITTHDFELCEIKDSKIQNYHFTEYYEGENIRFDYKIRNGRCQTTNAKFLMKLAGIIEE